MTTESAITTRERAWAEELATRLVDAARKKGASLADAAVSVGSSLSADARDGQIEDVTRASSRAAGVRAIVDGKLGFATAAAAPRSPAEIDELALHAVALARVSTASSDNVLPVPTAPRGADLDARVRALALFDDETAALDAAWATEQALLMERVLTQEPGIVTVRDVGASARHSVFGLASSTGFVGSYGGTAAQLYASGVALDSADKKQIDGWWSAARRARDLENPETIAKEAARRALRRRGAKKIASARMPVIFDPNVARTFFGAILGAISGELVAKQSSFLAGKKGEPLLVPGHAIVDDPLVVGGLASRPFDGEGVDVAQATLFDDAGVLCVWLHDARSAQRLAEAPTGHAARGATTLPEPAPSNVVVTGGRGDLASIVKDTKRGLLVTHLLGHGPDMVTGEYSRGASGFLVEDGALSHAVEEVTIAGDMLAMMKGMDRIGADLDRRSSLLAPTIRFAELAISGT